MRRHHLYVFDLSLLLVFLLKMLIKWCKLLNILHSAASFRSHQGQDRHNSRKTWTQAAAALLVDATGSGLSRLNVEEGLLELCDGSHHIAA